MFSSKFMSQRQAVFCLSDTSIMDFGSEYILDEEEEEEIEDSRLPKEPIEEDDDQYYGDYSGFECEIMDFDEEEIETPNKVKVKKVTTNTVKLEMKKLSLEADLIIEKSKLVTCKGDSCGAVYSYLSKKDDEKKVWTCNFCCHANDIDVELPDLSDKNDIMYVDNTSNIPELTPPDSSKRKIIFVIDTSSSMCQTKPMDLTKASQTLKEVIQKDNEKQYAIQQQLLNIQFPAPPAMTHGPVDVTRLQAIKASVIEAINKLSQSQGDTRVGLVTFQEDVMVYGDGRNVVKVEGVQLQDKAELQAIGKKARDFRPVHESALSLKDKIASLDELGRTALGPALVIAQSMAGDSEGSKVILCTDGVANIGLGRLEETTDNEINSFYSEIISDSIISGVSVTLFCVDNAGLDTRLGQVPTETGGLLEKIPATELEAKLSEELSRQTVAVNTDITFIVHKDLYVPDTKNPGLKCSKYLQKLGNLQLDKQVSFSFAFKPSNPQEQPQAQPGATDNGEAVSDEQSVPFQVIVKYKTLSGVEVSRVWTAERKITKNRSQAEGGSNPKTVIENFMQQSSQKMLEQIFAKKYLVDQANTFSNSGQDLLKHYSNSDLGAVENKLKQFISMMNEIVRNRQHTEEQIVELNRLKESRSSGLQG